MIYLFTFLGIFFSIKVLKRKRSLDRSSGAKTLKYFFYKSSLDFLIPFSVVAFIFMVLTILFSFQNLDKINLQALITMEQKIESFRATVAVLKLSAAQSLLLLLFVYLISILRLPRKNISVEPAKRGLARIVDFFLNLFDKYQTAVKYVVIVTTLTASFTFFGRQVGEPSSKLEAKIKFAQEGYAENKAGMRESVEFEFLNESYRHVNARLSNKYDKLLSADIKFSERAENILTEYASKSSIFKHTNKTLERVFARISEKALSIENLNLRSKEQANHQYTENVKREKTKISKSSQEFKRTLSTSERITPERILANISIERNHKIAAKLKAAALQLTQKAPAIQKTLSVWI